ncbi:hypothetical protein GF312_04865 [Candidatus Poribacteria bacterium]|nr:hypothetical protein [Candidatus Poribacteria bacterium]
MLSIYIKTVLKFIPGLYLGWGLGSNDAANVFGPQVNSGIIRYWKAVTLSAVFIVIGAILEGQSGLDTIGGIADINLTKAILSAFSAALVVNVMSYLRIPVSATQAVVGSIIGLSIFNQGSIDYTRLIKIVISWIATPIGGALIAFVCYHILAFIWQKRVKNLMTFNYTVKILSIVIGCYAAYSLGANNLANVMGAYVGAGLISPFRATVLGGISITIGVLTYSRNVMYTVGEKITQLSPFSALVAVLSEAFTLHIFTQIGVPVSSSQAVVGAVIGVGLVKGTGMVNKKTLINIFAGWVFTVIGAAFVAFLMLFLLNSFAFGEDKTMSISDIKIYSQPGDESPSEDYSVKVNGKPVFVYKARVSAVPLNQVWPGYQRPLEQTEMASFVYWDMSGSADVEVVSNIPVEKVDIRPKSHNIKPLVEGNRIIFQMPEPGYATVEINGIHHALHIFVSQIEENVPEPDDPDVYHFAPGIHNPGKIELKTGESVYIAGGAVVHGLVTSSNTSDIRILGRGILDTSTFKREGNPGPITLHKCQNVKIEGIIIRDSNVWAITPRDCENLDISNIKLIGFWRYNADGIDIVNSRNVTIDNCFIRSFDDSIVVKGLRGTGDKPVKNMLVTNCVIWNDWGRAMEIGAETVAPEISDITFKNCDIIHTVHIAMDIQHGDRALIKNIRFEDIRFEIEENPLLPIYQSSRDQKYSINEKDKYCPQLFVLIIRENNYSHDKERGNIQNILFKEISVTGECFPGSYFVGYDEKHKVKGVKIENLTVNGKQITNIDEARIRIGDFVEDVSF